MGKFQLKSSYLQMFAHGFWRFIKNLSREFLQKGCQKSAAALTYMTLFALVPLMTVTYSMFSVIPVFDGVADQLQSLIFSHFLPESGSEVQQYLSDFSSQARSLTGAGVGLLVVTAYLMLTNIEKTFNTIWGVQHARRGLTSFLLYWAVLSIGPILLGVGLLITTYLLSLKLWVNEFDQLGLVPFFLRFVPLLLTSAAFTLLFAAVPNCRVPIKFAVVGGVITAICFELLKFAFGLMVANSDFKLIYGAFAVVPLFLLWINFLWTIILAGAVFVRTLAEQGYSDHMRKQSDMSAMLKCLVVFWRRSHTGDSVTDADCVKAGVGLVHWQSLRSILVTNNWIAVTDSGNYVLRRDLKYVTLWDTAKLAKLQFQEIVADSRTEKRENKSADNWQDDYHDRLEHIQQNARETFDISLDKLFGRVEQTKAEKTPAQAQTFQT